MKKIISLLLITVMVFPSLSFAAKERKECLECILKTNAVQAEKIKHICNDVSDVICKDVKIEERRSCSESDEYVFSKETSKDDIFNFAKGCFKSGVTSFTQFFTDFIPELLKGIWEANKALYSLAAKSITGDEPGLWSKLKGMYESTSSVAADIYEAVQENPGAYFDKIWSKLVDVVGPMVANYDCLKPQKKIENICGFVAGWVVPPAMLAKILVRGVKEVKFLKEAGVFSASTSGKLAKALEFSEKRSLLTLKQLQGMEIEIKALGYTRDEFALLYKSGALDKISLKELKSLSTAEGRAQKAKLLGEIPKTTAASVVPKKQVAMKPKPVELNLSSDFITTTKIGPKGEKLIGNGQIVERMVHDGKEVAYRIRMVDGGGAVHEMTLTSAELAAMNAKNASFVAAERVADLVSKDKKYASADDEFMKLQKRQEADAARANMPDDLKSLEVKETDFGAFEEAQRAQVKADAQTKALREAQNKPAKVDGMEVNEAGMDEFDKAVAAQKAAQAKTEAQLIANKRADYLAEQKRIKEQGIVERDGIAVEELAHDDPRYLEMFGGKEKAVNPKYQNGIDYVATKSPGKIVKTEEKVPVKTIIKDGKPIAGAFQSDYIQVMARNSMGSTTMMPAQIIKKVLEDRTEKYVIRVLDKSSNTYKEMTVTLQELKVKLRAKEAPKVERELTDFNRQTGFQDDLH